MSSSFCATRLTTKHIPSTDAAPMHLGMNEMSSGGERLRPLVFVPSRLVGNCSRFFYVIPKGFVGLVASFGQYVGVWQPGLHFAPSWIEVSHLIPTQYVVYETPVKECPTQDNVMVTIDVTLVLRVLADSEKDLYNFCFQLGPEKLNEMLKAFEEDAVRGMVRARRYDQIYDMMSSSQDRQFDNTMRELNNQFGRYGVEITSVSVTNVHLPTDFAQTMEEATVWHNRNEYKLLQQEYDIKKIEAREAEAKHTQKTKEDLERAEAEYNRDLAQIQKQLENEKAETVKQLAAMNEKEKALVLQIVSQSASTVANISRQRDVLLASKKSEGAAESERIRIDAKIEVDQRIAAADAEIAVNNAEALGIEAEAELRAIQSLTSVRAYHVKMRSLQALRALSKNPNVSISGHNGDHIVAQLVANQRSGAVLGVDPR